jgi:two-component system, chemotaxis family, chemotaxis protein CheY
VLKAIVLDGNAITRDLLHQVLSNGGHQVVGDCSSASQGLALIIKHKPHFVCVERKMLEDNVQFLEKIRQSLPKGLIFMVCSELDAKTLQEYMAQGVHGFIIKPFNTGAVLSTIKNAILNLIKQQQAKAAEAGAKEE